MKRLEEVISAYWEVGTALRHPEAPPLSASDALDLLRERDRLVPVAEEARLLENMHTLTFDIIEGNTEWRSHETQAVNSQLIPFTRN